MRKLLPIAAMTVALFASYGCPKVNDYATPTVFGVNIERNHRPIAHPTDGQSPVVLNQEKILQSTKPKDYLTRP